MKYLNHDEYTEIGGICDATAFNRYSVRAFSKIANETQNRIDKMSSVPEEVKHLCRDLIEYLSNNVSTEKVLTGASQSLGGDNESESYAVKTAVDIDNDINNMIDDYLRHVTDDNGIPLLYRGCGCC